MLKGTHFTPSHQVSPEAIISKREHPIFSKMTLGKLYVKFNALSLTKEESNNQ